MTFPAYAPSAHRSSRAGFSLIEILTVVALIGVLASFVVPAVSSLKGAGDLNRVGYDVAGVLEQARAYAMAHNTYAWVGFSEESGRLKIGIVASKNGERTPQNTDAGAGDATVVSLSKIRTFDNTELLVAPATGDRPEADPTAQVAAKDAAILPFSVGSGVRKSDFDKHVIQFNNRGEASLANGSIQRVIEIGFHNPVTTQGGTPKNYVAIQVAGLSGSVQVYRP